MGWIVESTAKSGVSNALVQELAQAKVQLAQAKARIAELEMQLAHRDAELTRERNTRAAAEAKHSTPGGTVDDEDPAAVGPMGKRVFKLVLRLDSPNDNEVLLAAQKLVRELKANGSDLRTLAAALGTEWEKQQKAKPAPPPPINYSEVEAAVTRYAADRTTVNLNRMWKALKVEVPALNADHRDRGTTVAHHLMGCLSRLGFAGSSSGRTWRRT